MSTFILHLHTAGGYDLHFFGSGEAQKVDAGFQNVLCQTDQCDVAGLQFFVLLTQNTGFMVELIDRAGEFVDVQNDPHIIAHAMLESDVATDGYQEFELELEYRDMTRTPKYVVISACGSYLGDYFTGGTGSLMYVDEFEFVY